MAIQQGNQRAEVQHLASQLLSTIAAVGKPTSLHSGQASFLRSFWFLSNVMSIGSCRCSHLSSIRLLWDRNFEIVERDLRVGFIPRIHDEADGSTGERRIVGS